MALIKNGYWTSTMWASNYWQTNFGYWSGYVPTMPYVVGMERSNLLWTPEYIEDLWIYVLTVLASE